MSGPADWATQGTQRYDQGAQRYDQGPQGYGPPPIPPTNAGWAVAATLFFWPLAFTAWTASSNVVRLWAMGDLAGAQAASDQAKRMGKIALVIIAVLAALYVVAIIAFVALAASAASTITR